MKVKKLEIKISYALLVLIMIFYLGPVFWIIITSVLPQELLTSVPLKVNFDQVTFDYYRRLFISYSFLMALKNSFVVTSITTILSIIIASFGAYVVTRFNFPGRNIFLFSGLSMQMGPAIVFLIPLFVILNKIKLIDTHIGLILVFLVFISPVAMWLLLGFFESVPKEIEEAAYIDGCNRFYTLIKIILPVVKPGIIAASIVVFISVWGDLLIPLIITIHKSTTLTVFSSSFSGIYEINYGGAAATSTLSALPTILLALFFRNYLIKGLIEGSIKG